MKKIKITKMVELKPCPFCGEEEKLHIDNDNTCIECLVCEGEGPIGWGQEEIVEKWNSRLDGISSVCVAIDKHNIYDGKPRIFDHILTIREMEKLGISHWLFFQCSIEKI